MTLIGTPAAPAAGAADVMTDLQAGDGEAAAMPPKHGYDRSDVDSADAAEPVNTPDMPVIAAPPADPARPVATAQQGMEGQKPPVDLDADPVTGAPLAVAILGEDGIAVEEADPAAVAAAAVAQASAELTVGAGPAV